MSLRVLHVSDSHIGSQLPGRPRAAARTRGHDLIDSFHRALQFAREQPTDLVIHTGDLFDAPHPGSHASAAACEPLCALAQRGIPVVIVPGNHERCAIPESLFLAHPMIHVARRPRTFDLELGGVRVAICAIPCVRNDVQTDFPLALAEARCEARGADVRILAVHQAFEGARCGPANYRFRAGEQAAALDQIPAGSDIVLSGHVHRHQALDARGVPLVYAGSTDRVSFAELDEPKGVVAVELDGRKPRWRFVEHAVRPMAIVAIDVSGFSSSELRERVLEAVSGAPRAAVLSIRLSGRTAGAVVRGLRLTQAARALRPDVDATISWRSVEWAPQRELTLRGGLIASEAGDDGRSVSPRRAKDKSAAFVDAFATVDGPPIAAQCAAPGDLRALPRGFGVYAMLDAAGRLLYVGKSGALRARVAAHLRGDSAGGHFARWAQQVRKVQARPANSEMEALLIEADLVRRVRPPFNRQMRMWRRYCYLVEADGPHAQLAVSPDPVAGRTRLGPIRSRYRAAALVDLLARRFQTAACPPDERSNRQLLHPSARLCERYFDGRCGGPCADRVSATEYAARITARDAWISVGAEFEPGAIRAAGDADGASEATEEADAALALIEMLRSAAELLGAIVVLPSTPGRALLAAITADGLRLYDVANGELESGATQDWVRRAISDSPASNGPVVPKASVDALCAAARELRRRPDLYRVLPKSAQAVERDQSRCGSNPSILSLTSSAP
ncbi:MAG: metallophosphoesterase family protein [Phycisphaerae bacterium]